MYMYTSSMPGKDPLSKAHLLKESRAHLIVAVRFQRSISSIQTYKHCSNLIW